MVACQDHPQGVEPPNPRAYAAWETPASRAGISRSATDTGTRLGIFRRGVGRGAWGGGRRDSVPFTVHGWIRFPARVSRLPGLAAAATARRDWDARLAGTAGGVEKQHD